MDRVGVGPRALALIIDSLLFFVVACCVGVFFVLAGDSETDLDSTSPLEALLNLVLAGLFLAYFIAMEGTSGTTLGKRLLKLRVVKVDGSPITLRDAAIRNVLRIVDGFFVYLVGAILIWTSPAKQRLGDRLADTIVVRDVPRVDTYEPPFPSTPEQRF